MSLRDFLVFFVVLIFAELKRKHVPILSTQTVLTMSKRRSVNTRWQYFTHLEAHKLHIVAENSAVQNKKMRFLFTFPWFWSTVVSGQTPVQPFLYCEQVRSPEPRSRRQTRLSSWGTSHSSSRCGRSSNRTRRSCRHCCSSWAETTRNSCRWAELSRDPIQ